MQKFIEVFESKLEQAKTYVRGLCVLQKKYDVETALGWYERGMYMDSIALTLDRGKIHFTVEHDGWEANWSVTLELPEDVDAKLAETEARILQKIEDTEAAQKRMQEAAKLLKDEEERKEFERLKAKFGV